MKGCARSLLLQLAGFLALAGAILFVLHHHHGVPPEKAIGATLFAALFGCVGVGFLVGITRPVRERKALRDCLAGKRPADGKRTGIVGRIDPVGETLRSPLSGTECLAYKYEIYRITGSGKRRMKYVFFDGIALVPSVVAAPSGSFRLLAVPAFDFGTAPVEPERAIVNWTGYAKTAPFEPETSRRNLEKQWTDDDGAYRCDKRKQPASADVPLEHCTFQEDLIRKGEMVYVVGLFSESRGGVVPHANWARETRIMKGDADGVLRQLRARIVRYVIGGVLCLAASAGILFAFVSHLRP
jgi:hypothetical protein